MLHDFRTVLRGRRARVVLLAVALSVVGDGAGRVGLLLRVHDAGAGPGALALVLVLYAVPLILLAGVAGRLADLPDVRPVLAAAGAVQAAAAVFLAWRLDLVSTALGVTVLQIGFALANSAWVVALPRLVEPQLAGSLVSVHHAALGVATPVGAALGGVAFERYGAAAPFVLDAVSFVPLVAVALLVPTTVRPSSAPPGGPWRTLLPLDGLSALRRQPLLAVLTAAVLPFIVALESVNAVEVYLAKDVLGGTSAQFGLTESGAGLAAVIGALGASAVTTTERRARAIVAALAVISVVQLAQGLAPCFVAYAVLAAAVGMLLGGVSALVMTLMVTATELATRGRVVALVGGASRSCTMLALALGGLLGSAIGPRPTFVVVGVLGLGIALAAQSSVARRLREEVAVGRRGRPGPDGAIQEYLPRHGG